MPVPETLYGLVLAGGRKVKFWAANAGPGIWGLDHKSQIYLAKRLAKSGVNIFAYKDGVLMTPDTGVLHGITRRTAIELAEGLNVETRIAPLAEDTLRSCDEIFLTSTAGGIMPVRTLDGGPVGDGAPGPLATRLRQLYWEAHDDPQFSEPVRGDGV